MTVGRISGKTLWENTPNLFNNNQTEPLRPLLTLTLTASKIAVMQSNLSVLVFNHLLSVDNQTFLLIPSFRSCLPMPIAARHI